MQFLAIVLGQPPHISSNQSLPHLVKDSVAITECLRPKIYQTY